VDESVLQVITVVVVKQELDSKGLTASRCKWWIPLGSEGEPQKLKKSVDRKWPSVLHSFMTQSFVYSSSEHEDHVIFLLFASRRRDAPYNGGTFVINSTSHW